MRTKSKHKKLNYRIGMGLLSLAFCTITVRAQNIDKFSIDSGGAIASAGGLQMLYTLGEVAVREVGAGTLQLSEGFINPNLFSTLGVESSPSIDAFKMFPNPVSEVLFLESSSAIDQVAIYDSLGKQVMSQSHSDAIDVKALNAGTYFIKIYSKDTIIHRKFIKM